MRPWTTRIITLYCLPVPLLMQLSLPGCPGVGGSGGNAFNLPPVPLLASDVQTGVVPLRVQFDSSGSTDDGLIVSRLWSFGDGTTSVEIAPSHTYTATGDYTVTLTLTDDEGGVATRSAVISVTQRPIAAISVDQMSVPSAPAVFSFDASQSVDPDGQIVAYRWDFGDGASETLALTPHTYATPGTYRVILTVTDNRGVTDTAEVVVQVGISQPTITLRVPPAGVENLAAPQNAPLWVYAETEVTPGVPFNIQAGLDGDSDPCDAQTVIYDSTGGELVTLSGHSNRVTSAVFSPDGSRVLSASIDGSVRLFDSASGAPLATHENASAANSVAFSPDGERFVYGLANGGVVVREIATGALVLELNSHTDAVLAVAYSADGQQIASGGADNRAIAWDAENGTILRDFATDQAVQAVAFSPSDSSILAVGVADSTARIFSIISGGLLQTLTGHTDAVNAIAFSPDGSQLLTGGSDGTARLWLTVDGSFQRTLSGHMGAIRGVAFSPDGDRLLTGGDDDTARLWNESTGAGLLTVKPCASAISAVAFSPDGARFLTGVAARNDIVLDVSSSFGGPNGGDLSVPAPVPLGLFGVEPGSYSLWIEVDTDRTEPARKYYTTQIHVLDELPAALADDPPLVPLINDQVAISTAPGGARQIFDLGPMIAGDRVFLSLLTTPGYGSAFMLANDAPFSVLMLDAQEAVFAWLRNGQLFTSDARYIVGTSTSSLYVVVEGGQGLNVRVQRDVGVQPRPQRVLLNFKAATHAVANLPASQIQMFSAPQLNPAFTANDTVTMKTIIATTIQNLFADYNLQVFTSDSATPPAPPYITVLFDSSASGFVNSVETEYFGVADYLDPRNDTLTGTALIAANKLADEFMGETPAALAGRMGAVAAHHIGHLLGLAHVDNDADIMSREANPAPSQSFTQSPLTSVEISPPIGIQDAPLTLTELLGPSP